MLWRNGRSAAVLIAVGIMLGAVALAARGEKKAAVQETGTERVVTEAEVPAAAMETLRKLAAGAKIVAFAEESENDHVFYEGSWETAAGANMDVLVDRAGALVEIEERMEAGQVPQAVRELALKTAGKSVPLLFEKKTKILYEVKFEDADGEHELLLTPDGSRVEEGVEKGKANDDADDEEEEEGSEQLSLRKVPKAVRATILRNAKRRQVEEIERENEGGAIVYEAKVIANGQETELVVAADGTLISKKAERDDDAEDAEREK